MPIRVEQRSLFERTKASIGHKPTPLKLVPIEKKLHSVRLLSVTNYPPLEISQNYSTSDRTFAPAMESAVASSNSDKPTKGSSGAPGVRQRCQLEVTIPQRVDLLPIRDGPKISGFSSAPSPGSHCPFGECPKKDYVVPGYPEFLQHLHDYHYTAFKCSTPHCTFYDFKYTGGSSTICSTCFNEHPELQWAKHLDATPGPSSQPKLSAEIKEIKLHHNRSVKLQGKKRPLPPPKSSSSKSSDGESDIPMPTAAPLERELPATGITPSSRTDNAFGEAAEEAIDTVNDDADREGPDYEDCDSTGEEINWEPLLNRLFLTFGDRAMNEFHSIINPQWAKNRSGTNSSRTSTTTRSSTSMQTTSSTSQRSHSNGAALKRAFRDRDSLPPNDRGDDDPKKQRVKSTTNSMSIDGAWACPYHKREVLRSGINTRHTGCAARRYDCLSSLKEHLYRKHLVFQCERCGCEFLTHAERVRHLRAEIPCNVKDPHVPEGVTEEKKERLKSKKNLPSDKIGQWKLIYEILFPGEEIPSPYYNDHRSPAREIPRRTPTVPAESAQSMHSTLTTGSGSRDSEEIRRFEEACKGRLSEQFRMIVESELRDFISGIPEKIRDACDAVRTSVIQSSQHPNSEGSSTYNGDPLGSIDEVPRQADGLFGSAPRCSGTRTIASIPACFDIPPPQEPLMQMPTLEQAKGATCHTADSTYYSIEQTSHCKSNHKFSDKTTEVTSTSDDATNSSTLANPLGGLFLTSPLRPTFDLGPAWI